MENPFIALDLSTSPTTVKSRLEFEWEQFIAGANSKPDIRPLVLQSWRRCIEQGVHPLQNKAPILLSKEDARNYLLNDPLYLLLEPLLNKLKESAVDSGHMMVFCDSKGRIMHLDGDLKLRTVAEHLNFIVGASWAEKDAGTNSMGTALASGFPVQVFAAEHFCQNAHQLTCSAAPIRDPATREVLGVFNLTGCWNAIHPHSLSVVVAAAQAMEERLKSQLEVERFMVLNLYLEAISQGAHGHLIALDRGCNVLKAPSLLYEEGWIDAQNRLKDFPDSFFLSSLEQEWESNGKYGTWRFIPHPCVHERRTIGAIIEAIPSHHIPSKTVPTTKYSFSSLIGHSPDFLSVVSEAQSAAGNDLPVLIEGESGTGKELIAQSIHAASRRSQGPFVAVNCGAIPKDLAASELFGFDGGTFTGAAREGRIGKFQQANGGTIFLDEISEMSPDLQTLLLRVLEEGEVVRLGGRKPVRLNIRVIAATNRNIMSAVEQGAFRSDLYYRINLLSLRVPPLRDRPGDIPLLMQHLLQKACRDLGRPLLQVDEKAMMLLETYEWPGNVRELRNFAYRLATRVKGNIVQIVDLPREVHKDSQTGIQPLSPQKRKHITQKSTLKDHELEMIRSVLHELNGNVTETARRLGIHRSTIYRKLGRTFSKENWMT